jgi:hypothetical protein
MCERLVQLPEQERIASFEGAAITVGGSRRTRIADG